MTGRKQIRDFADAMVSGDGRVARFDLTTTAREVIPLQVSSGDLGKLIGFLLAIMSDAAKQQRASPAGPSEMPLVARVPVDMVSISPGKVSGEHVIVFGVGEMSLGFVVPPVACQALCERLDDSKRASRKRASKQAARVN